LASMILVIGGGIAVYRLIERPMLRVMHGYTEKSRARQTSEKHAMLVSSAVEADPTVASSSQLK